jgi:A/G-specific adenine glycosylase
MRRKRMTDKASNETIAHLVEGELAAILLDWWDEDHRDLPWRRNKSGYRVWIAEVMLQQTQIATVIPYYERWMARFPTVAAVAAAPLDQILKVWQGLGYYSRARNIHRAAKQIEELHNGLVPDNVLALTELPGIGRYTAGAIASIAYEKQVPVLDGNVIRVLSRLIDLPDDVTQTTVRSRLWQIAAALVPPDRAGDYNQALMELGQRICLGPTPRCSNCPANHLCLARRNGTQYERPVRPPRKRTPHVDVVAGVIWRDQPAAERHFLIARRPLDGMLGGLWEFPGGKLEDGEAPQAALQREILEELAIDIEVGQRLTTIKHAYTHFRITLDVYHARLADGVPQNIGVVDHEWVTLDNIDRYPFAVTDLKIIMQLRKLFA